MGRDILARMAAQTVLAVRCRGDEWPRGVFAGIPVPDGWVALLERRDGRRRLVPAGDDPRGDPSDLITIVRDGALLVPLTDSGGAAGGYDVRVKLELQLRVPARDHELAALNRTLLRSGELHAAELAERLGGAGGRTAIRRFVAHRPVEELVAADQRPALLTDLRAQLRDFLFESGLELERVATADFSSAARDHEQAERSAAAQSVATIQARELVEQAAVAATRRKLDDLSGVFAKLRDIADGSCRGQWKELFPALSPSERGRLLKNLWRLSPDRRRARTIAAITSEQLVFLDPAAPTAPPRTVSLPNQLGPLRSIAHHPGLGLLIGTAAGIWQLQVDAAEVAAAFRIPTPAQQPTTGVNSVAVFANRLIGTHSQLGAWAWTLADPSAPPQLLVDPRATAARTIRAATSTPDGRLLIAVDDRVCAFDEQLVPAGGFESAAGAIHALAICGEDIFASTAKGLVVRDRLDGAQGVWEVVHREPAAVESLTARNWDDLTELVIAGGPRGVLGIYPEQDVVTPLLEGPAPVRRAWVSDDAIVALSDLRDRLLVLHAPTSATPIDVPLARRLSSPIQDATIVTVAAADEPAA